LVTPAIDRGKNANAQYIRQRKNQCRFVHWHNDRVQNDFLMQFDSFGDLRVLVAVAETGALTSAGKRCGLSTAAVSSAIKRLEDTLRVRLFERSTRSVRVTAEGAVMIDHARRALDLVEQGQAKARAGVVELSGHIRLTATPLMAREMLGTWLADFVALHPNVTIDLLASDAHVDLVREGVDLALRHGPLIDSTYIARLLVPQRRIACASNTYLARSGVLLEPTHLAVHECLLYETRGKLLNHWIFEPLDGKHARCEIDVFGRLVCNDIGMALLWVLEGRGVAYLPELFVSSYFKTGQLLRLFPSYVGSEAPIYALLPSNRYVPNRVSELVRWLYAHFAKRVDSVPG
jgi:DNA-binding transcriptional LysR family regulator